jgi:hypothetical protein
MTWQRGRLAAARPAVSRYPIPMKLLSFAASVVLFSTAARADSRSWATVKGLLPDHVNAVAGANLATLRGTSLYASLLPTLMAKEPALKQAIDMAKSTCAIDLEKSIVDATFATGSDERGVVIIALDKSIDQKRVVDCMTKFVAASAPAPAPKAEADLKGAGGLKGAAKKPDVAKDVAKAPPAPPAPKLLVKTTGKITEYGVDTETQRLFVAWLAPDVVAIATDFDDKPLLEKMLAGKGTKGTMSTFLSKAPSSAAVWLATTKPQAMPTGGTMKGAFGTIDTTKGNVNVDVSIVLGSAKEAKGFVDQVTALLADARGGIPAQFHKLVDALKLSASADAANVKLSASEKDVLPVLSLAMMNR